MQKLLPAIRSIAGDVCVPARQCASTSCSWQSRASAEARLCHEHAPWDTSVHQSWHVASQQSWAQPGRLPYLGHAASALSTNPRYGRVAEASCWWRMLKSFTEWRIVSDMGWISADRGGRCSWSVAKRLEACIRAEGGHYEHLLWCCLPDILVATHYSRFSSQRPMPTPNRLFSQQPTFGGTQHYLQSDEKV